MVRNILFTLLFVVALVGCNNDDETDKTFLENYEEIIWKREVQEGPEVGRIIYFVFENNLNSYLKVWDQYGVNIEKDCFNFQRSPSMVDENHSFEIVENSTNKFECLYTDSVNTNEIYYTNHVKFTIEDDKLIFWSRYTFYDNMETGVNIWSYDKSLDNLDNLTICKLSDNK